MPYITKTCLRNGEIRFRVQIKRKGMKKTINKTFDSRTKAKEWAQEIECQIRNPKYLRQLEAVKRTVGDVIDRYINIVLPEKPDMIVNQTQQLKWWKNRIGEVPLLEVSPVMIADCRDSLASEKTNRGVCKKGSTINRYLAALSVAFTYAVNELGWLDENPVKRVRRKSESKPSNRRLSKEEKQRLFEACKVSDSQHLYLAVRISLETGGRQNEVMTLKWKDINLQTRQVLFTITKNDEPKNGWISEETKKLLIEQRKVTRIDTDLIFPGKINLLDPHNKRSTINPIELRTPWKTALKRANISNFRWHDLRHTFASDLAETGISQVLLGELMGHKTPSMTRRYVHLSNNYKAQAVERMHLMHKAS